MAACSSNKNKSNIISDDLNAVADSIETDDLTELPIFSECKNYCNNLSEIAQEVHFVALDTAVLIRDRDVHDIAFSEDYIFVSGIYEIHQFTRKGKYVKDIGRRGQGPTEYVQLKALTQLDRDKQWVYAQDVMQHKIKVYDFNGTFIKALPSKRGLGAIALIDSNLIAIRPGMDDHDGFSQEQNIPKIHFIDTTGKPVKFYKSSLYPYKPFQEHPRTSKRGPRKYGDYNPLWNYQQKYSYWEYASDTIFRIISDSLRPRYLLTGNLKPTLDDYFKGNTGNQFIIHPTQATMRANSCIYESGEYLIFHMLSDYLRFYMLYDKKTKELFRTYFSDAPVLPPTRYKSHEVKLMNYFVDDIYSGFHFTIDYQSEGYAMTLIPTDKVLENKDKILGRLKNNPSEEAQNLKRIIENISDFDNSLLMMVKFK
jgi:hypothetical protein